MAEKQTAKQNKKRPVKATLSRDAVYIFPDTVTNKKIWDIAAAVLIFLGTVWMISFCRNGSGVAIDEAFYLTIPKRLLDGDGLLTDEWQLSQLSSVLLLPFVKLWYLIRGNSDGLYMASCCLFCVCQGIFCGLVYRILRQYRYAVLCAVICLLQFSVMNYFSLSYNTIGLMVTVLLMCLIFRLSQRESGAFIVLSGVLYAVLVLCNPFTIIAFPFYVFAAVFFIVREKNGKPAPFCLLSLRGFLLFIAGILPVFIYFIIILFSHSSLKDILAAIPYILSDSEHMVTDGGGSSTFSVVHFITEITDNMGVVPFVLSLLLYIGACVMPARAKKLSFPLLVAGSVIGFSGAFIHYFSPDYTTEEPACIYAVLFGAAFALYFVGGRKHKAVFYTFIVGGLFYTLCMEAASNLGYHATANGFISCLPGAAILFAEYYADRKKSVGENKKEKGVLYSLCAVVLAITVFTAGTYTLGIRIGAVNLSGDDTIAVDDGFYSGKRMLKEQYRYYCGVRRDMEEADNILEDGDRLFVVNNLPVVYLESKKATVGAFSAWLFSEEQIATDAGRERFFAYYELNPDNMPDYIYVAAFGSFKEGLRPVNTKKYLEQYVSPYFEGESIKLNYGILFRVNGLKDNIADE